MAQNTNMDLKKEASNDGPQLEFTLPMNEVKESLSVGDKGKVMIPVEVTQVQDGMISFRKIGMAESQSNFRELSLEEEKKDIGVAER